MLSRRIHGIFGGSGLEPRYGKIKSTDRDPNAEEGAFRKLREKRGILPDLMVCAFRRKDGLLRFKAVDFRALMKLGNYACMFCI
jgi:hypothetical protein